MKSLVHFPILHGIKIKVSVGDKLNSDTVLGESPLASTLQLIPISKILGIRSEKIPKYLKKNIGEFVKKGEIIAEKRQVFSRLQLKSPIDSRLKEIDLKKGTLTLEIKAQKNEEIICPIAGKIKHITSDSIAIEIEGEVYPTLGGIGKDATGRIKFIKGERIGILDVTEEVRENVLLCENISGDLVAKLEVVGVKGLITCKRIPYDIEISYVQVSPDIFSKIKVFDDKEVCIMPEYKQIAIW